MQPLRLAFSYGPSLICLLLVLNQLPTRPYTQAAIPRGDYEVGNVLKKVEDGNGKTLLDLYMETAVEVQLLLEAIKSETNAAWNEASRDLLDPKTKDDQKESVQKKKALMPHEVEPEVVEKWNENGAKEEKAKMVALLEQIAKVAPSETVAIIGEMKKEIEQNHVVLRFHVGIHGVKASEVVEERTDSKMKIFMLSGGKCQELATFSQQGSASLIYHPSTMAEGAGWLGHYLLVRKLKENKQPWPTEIAPSAMRGFLWARIDPLSPAHLGDAVISVAYPSNMNVTVNFDLAEKMLNFAEAPKSSNGREIAWKELVISLVAQ